MITRLIAFSCIALLAVCLPSCTKPDITFGQAYLDNSFTNIVSVDTATPVISTVYVDSFVSAGTGKAVIGKYTDPVMGTITARSYFSVAPPTFSDIYSKGIYDSLELIIKPNKSYYGDTSLPIQVSVNQLTEKIAFAENSTSLYNNNSFTADDNPLGLKTLTIRPSVTDSVSIRLSDTEGKDLFNKFAVADESVKTSEEFIQYFKGIRISTGTSPACMIGFSDSIIMRLHYHDPDVIAQSKTINFTLSDKSLQFNEIRIDRSSTALASIGPGNNEMLSDATSNMSFLQSSTGTVVKVSFPYIRDFLTNTQFVKVVKAQLVVKPVNNSFSGFYPLPPQIKLSQTTQSDEVGADITTTNSSGTDIEYGDLTIDNLYGEKTEYTYDITNYIISQMAIQENNKNGLLLSPPTPAYAADFNRLILADKQKSPGSVQLKLYYISVTK